MAPGVCLVVAVRGPVQRAIEHANAIGSRVMTDTVLTAPRRHLRTSVSSMGGEGAFVSAALSVTSADLRPLLLHRVLVRRVAALDRHVCESSRCGCGPTAGTRRAPGRDMAAPRHGGRRLRQWAGVCAWGSPTP
jgi:hypothetical protein